MAGLVETCKLSQDWVKHRLRITYMTIQTSYHERRYEALLSAVKHGKITKNKLDRIQFLIIKIPAADGSGVVHSGVTQRSGTRVNDQKHSAFHTYTTAVL